MAQWDRGVMLDGRLVKQKTEVSGARLQYIESCGLEFVDGHRFLRPHNQQECEVEIVSGEIAPKMGRSPRRLHR